MSSGYPTLKKNNTNFDKENIFVNHSHSCHQRVFRIRRNMMTYLLCVPNRTSHAEAKAFNVTFRYIDDAMSINNLNFANWIPLIYHQTT
jgi:hypothetical protein